MKTLSFISALLLAGFAAEAAPYRLQSPDGKTVATINADNRISYSVEHDGKTLISPSSLSMKLGDGTVYGVDRKAKKSAKLAVDRSLKAFFYKKSAVRDNYNELRLEFSKFSLIVRAYDDGVAWRFVSKSKTPFIVESETTEFNFAGDWKINVPYVRSAIAKTLEDQFRNSFENTYAVCRLSDWDKSKLAFTPMLVDAGECKMCVVESDLRNYPGMFLYPHSATGLHGVMAPYPKDVELGGHNGLQLLVKNRENFIAKADAGQAFPWRAIVIADEDRQLTDNDMVFKLASSPEEGSDWSWVKPGKVAWDWWNDWNLSGVDFVSGVNNDTYKYYIDFAAAYGLEYVILDEGWSVRGKADLMQVVPEIDLPMLCKYAESRNVGIVLWAGWGALDKDMDNIYRHYSEMGVKGFKIDFMDRDDQECVNFCEKAAKLAARHHLFVDLHGAYKPAGICRTYPNVLNIEGVYGLEQMKWSNYDLVTYDVSIPFIRMVAGCMDYTPGAMRNATKANFRPVNSEPMSQGTRCHQLAEYVVFEAPFAMLCDTPSAYMKEPEYTKFLCGIPTVWDNTVALDGKVGRYVAIARKNSDKWYVGALNNWKARDIELDFSFLGSGRYKCIICKDGANAHRKASDYKFEKFEINASDKLKVHMAPGGGFVIQLIRL